MTDKRFQLQISEPCNEAWDEMKPTACGKFCDSCKKQVVDFTKMDDGEVLLFFKENKEKVCGRFRNDQLGNQTWISNKYVSWFRYVLQLIIPVALFSCTGVTTVGEAMPVPVSSQLDIDTTHPRQVLPDSVGKHVGKTDSLF